MSRRTGGQRASSSGAQRSCKQPSARRDGLQNERSNTSTLETRTKVWLEREGQFVGGDGGLHLLLAIARTGSLTEAARDIGWSSRHAWGYIRRAERTLGRVLTAPRPGRGARRGTVLTSAGRSLVTRMRELRDRLDWLLGPTGPSTDEIAARGQRRGLRGGGPAGLA